MAIKNIIAKGIGFSPGGIKWIITHGFSIGISLDYNIIKMANPSLSAPKMANPSLSAPKMANPSLSAPKMANIKMAN